MPSDIRTLLSKDSKAAFPQPGKRDLNVKNTPVSPSKPLYSEFYLFLSPREMITYKLHIKQASKGDPSWIADKILK